jgi:gliding motility-associated-like protein
MRRLLYFTILFSNLTNCQVAKPTHDPPEVVNKYTEVLAFNICTNSITVSDASQFSQGDTVLMIQMKGALIDTSNTAAFGNILDYKNAGNYEFNYISQKSGNILSFLNKLTRQYDIPGGVVQLVRIPKYKNGIFSGGLTCMKWDGTKGGILAITAINGLSCYENIDVTGMGFRGGEGFTAVLPPSNCFENNYNYPAGSQVAGFKGESIALLSQNINKGKGSPAAGGGGGLSHNSGGGGGANAGSAGFGGYQTDTCGNAPFDNRGIGGRNLIYSAAADKIFMGSGGGAGNADNADLTVPPLSGGDGGGIVIIMADSLSIFNYRIYANGADGVYCFSSNCSDGMAGGGGGGTILINTTKMSDIFEIHADGGNGASIPTPIGPGGKAGTGGGGGGGTIFLKSSSLPVNISTYTVGGLHGVTTGSTDPWGATDGSDGLKFFGLVLPFDSVRFKPNIDSVRLTYNANYCNNIRFSGLGFTNTFPVVSWQWDFGDGGTANTQNPTHNYNAVGNYAVKLIVTDINGCKDSITTTINTTGTMFADAGADSALCASGQMSVVLQGNGTGSYSWSPAAVLNNNTLQNPTATIDTTTKFYLIVSNGTGCSALDSVTITINKKPVVKTLQDTSICKNGLLILTTTGALSYSWSPGIYVTDSTIASPRYIDTSSHTLIVTGTASNGCKANDTINVSVRAPATFIAPQDKTLCKGDRVQLNGNNGNAFGYLWSPSFYLSNPNIKDPVANPPATIVYSLKITDNICNYDSSFNVRVIVFPLPFVNAAKSNDINCNKPFAQLNAGGASNYTWTPAFALTNSGIANPIANPAVTTTYFVTAADNNGCINKDSITLFVNFGNDGILLPNSFTPNKDGNNDCFGIRYYQDVQDMDFIIYNRYGTIVFETHNAADCWDGYYKGQPVDPGSYVYFIKAKTLCGAVAKKGFVLLLR